MSSILLTVVKGSGHVVTVGTPVADRHPEEQV
jgi:hypothetical protein